MPYYPPTPQRQPERGTAGKAAIGTVSVLVTLFVIFCVAPIAIALIFGAIGSILPD